MELLRWDIHIYCIYTASLHLRVVLLCRQIFFFYVDYRISSNFSIYNKRFLYAYCQKLKILTSQKRTFCNYPTVTIKRCKRTMRTNELELTERQSFSILNGMRILLFIIVLHRILTFYYILLHIFLYINYKCLIRKRKYVNIIITYTCYAYMRWQLIKFLSPN